jgi:hypothetical protein
VNAIVQNDARAIEVLFERHPERAHALAGLRLIDGDKRPHTPYPHGFRPMRGAPITPLGLAAQSGSAACLRALLARFGPDEDATCGRGVSALMLAVDSGQAESVAILIEHGADVFARDANGRPALCRAAQHGRLECQRAMLDAASPERAARAGEDGRQRGEAVVEVVGTASWAGQEAMVQALLTAWLPALSPASLDALRAIVPPLRANAERRQQLRARFPQFGCADGDADLRKLRCATLIDAALASREAEAIRRAIGPSSKATAASSSTARSAEGAPTARRL